MLHTWSNFYNIRVWKLQHQHLRVLPKHYNKIKGIPATQNSFLTKNETIVLKKCVYSVVYKTIALYIYIYMCVCVYIDNDSGMPPNKDNKYSNTRGSKPWGHW